MSKDFGNNLIGKKNKKQSELDRFVDDAKVDGSNTPDNQPNFKERRGASYKKDGRVVKLRGAAVQVMLNKAELDVLTIAAEKEGLPLSTLLRVTTLNKFK